MSSWAKRRRKGLGTTSLYARLGISSANKPMMDSTETVRRDLALKINSAPEERAALEERHGQVWSASELANDFEVVGFTAPFVVVRRKIDNRLGSLLFQHHPRYYFSFQEDK
jgi:hypothetical protein